MKRKSLNARKTNLNKISPHLADLKILNLYNEFKKKLSKIYNLQNLACAVSGGPDSLALTFLLNCYCKEYNKNITFFHVDHGLRKNSRKEAYELKKKLSKFKIKINILYWKGPTPKKNIQSIARDIRYNLIFKELEKNKISNVFFGHTYDDLLENFFIRLTRGSGLEGLISFNSIIKEYKNVRIIRPLLNQRKSNLIYLTQKVFSFYLMDNFNNNDLFLRVRLRKLINQLEEEGFNSKKYSLTLNNLSSANNSIKLIVDKNIANNSRVLVKTKGAMLSNNFFKHPDEIVFRSFKEIFSRVNQKYYPPRGKKISRLVKDIKDKKLTKTTLSGCIIEKMSDSVLISIEKHKKKAKSD